MRYFLVQVDTDDEDFEDYMLESLEEAIDQSECGFIVNNDYKPLGLS